MRQLGEHDGLEVVGFVEAGDQEPGAPAGADATEEATFVDAALLGRADGGGGGDVFTVRSDREPQGRRTGREAPRMRRLSDSTPCKATRIS